MCATRLARMPHVCQEAGVHTCDVRCVVLNWHESVHAVDELLPPDAPTSLGELGTQLKLSQRHGRDRDVVTVCQ